LDDILQEMSTPGIRKLLDHGEICTQVDYKYWMIFSKRCPHQALENYLIMVRFVLKLYPHQTSREVVDHGGI
jgi:hypothetical protein